MNTVEYTERESADTKRKITRAEEDLKRERTKTNFEKAVEPGKETITLMHGQLVSSNENNATELNALMREHRLPSDSADGVCVRGYLLSAMVRNAQSRSGCHYKVYKFAEKHHAQVREGMKDDGIVYFGSTDLKIQLVFEDKCQAEQFESAVTGILLEFTRRTDSSMTSVLDLVVDDITIQLVDLSNVTLRTVMESHYTPVPEDGDPLQEDKSIASSLCSDTSAVELNEEVKLRLLNKDNCRTLFRLKPLKCCLMSQRLYPKFANNPNNILFMSTLLRNHLEIINSTEGIATFYMDYVLHKETPIEGEVNQRRCPVYETQVNIVFKDELAKNILSGMFRECSVVDERTIQIKLYFPGPLEFKEFAAHKAALIKLGWISYDKRLV